MNVTVIGSASAVSPEERALRDLYLEHGPALYAYVLRMLGGDTHRAEDILQETLLRCWNKQTLADGEGMAIRPWMFRIARNLVIDAHRMRMARPMEIGGNSWLSDMCDEVDDIERMLSSMLVRDALRSLTPAHREALQATIFADRTTQQAADGPGSPPGHGEVPGALRPAQPEVDVGEQRDAGIVETLVMPPGLSDRCGPAQGWCRVRRRPRCVVGRRWELMLSDAVYSASSWWSAQT